ncbi:hypothetical protein C8R44DRAFT_990756 [Mycena epipterygia]|nr:hypothetical protein C8R44DRAFT_990756 [Mycena epipterygia]
MSTKSTSSAVTNPGQSSAKSQTKPMTAISAPHPLLKSSRGRVLWPDQRIMPSEKKHGAAFDDGLGESAIRRTRQRTSSVTSVETIRLRVKTRVADALLKPKPPLDETPIAQRSTRKRTHSATSPEVDSDDSSALQTGPRVRQRKDSNSTTIAAPLGVDERMATVKMKKLKDKFTPPQTAEVSDIRPSFPTRSTSSVGHIDNTSAQSQSVAPPSKQTIGTGTTRSKGTVPAPKLSSPAQARSLSTNTESKHMPIRLPIAGSRLSKYNCYELYASEYNLAVTFPSSSRSNFEVWDQEDELFLVGPLSLHLTLKDPGKWDNLPVSHPDVSVLELTCTSKPVVDAPTYPYCTASAAESNKYRVRYTGAKMRSPAGVVRAVDPARGIAVETAWINTYGAHTRTRYDTGGATQRGWSMEFFVPIATRLFEKRETRAFQVDALVSVWDQRLAAEVATMSVSHLMREREMVRR